MDQVNEIQLQAEQTKKLLEKKEKELALQKEEFEK